MFNDLGDEIHFSSEYQNDFTFGILAKLRILTFVVSLQATKSPKQASATADPPEIYTKEQKSLPDIVTNSQLDTNRGKRTTYRIRIYM